MQEFVTAYQNITTTGVNVAQQLGLLMLPLGIAIVTLINFLGGIRAIAAVGTAIAALAIFTMILNSAVGISTWIQKPVAVTASVSPNTPAAPAVAKP